MEVNNDVEKQDEAILFSLLHKNILGQLREEGNWIRVSLKSSDCFESFSPLNNWGSK